MRIFAYCAASFVDSTRRAAGVPPLTCPPVNVATFDPAWLAGRDLIYFDLHGEPGRPYWAGDQGQFALRVEQVRRAHLDGAIVFAVSCYLADTDSPMLDALLRAGARYVVGGDGRNWEGPRAQAMYGAGLLGQWFRRGMQAGLDPLRALGLAKRRLRLSLTLNRVIRSQAVASAARDTLAFRAYERKVA